MKQQKLDSNLDFTYRIYMISIGLILSLMLFSCSNDYREVMSNVDLENRPAQEARNIEIVRTDSGKVIFKMIAPVLMRYSQIEEEPYEEFPEGLTVISYSNYPQIESSITCKYAIHLTKKDLWEAKDDVVAINIEGDTVTTEQLFWDVKAERIYSDKYVSIRRNDEIMYGMGFESDQMLRNGRIEHFKGSFNLKE